MFSLLLLFPRLFGIILSTSFLLVVDDLHVGECFVVAAAATTNRRFRKKKKKKEKRDDVVQSDLDAGRNGRYIEYIYNSSSSSFFLFYLWF